MLALDEDRGTGRTSQQLKFAPRGAIFIWCNQQLDYPQTLALCHWIDRPDLTIIGPGELEKHIRGRRIYFVVDHAARLTEIQAHMLLLHRTDAPRAK
jgi:hypothetical protein